MGYFLLPTSPQHIFSTPLPVYVYVCVEKNRDMRMVTFEPALFNDHDTSWDYWYFLHAILLNQLTQVNEPSISSFYSFWHPLLFQIHKNIRSWHCSGFWWKLQFLYLDEKTNILTSWPLQTSAGGSWTSRQVAEDPWDFPRYVLCSGAPQLPPWKQAGSLHWSAKDEPWDWSQHSLDSFLSKGICFLGIRNLSLSVWNLLHV